MCGISTKPPISETWRYVNLVDGVRSKGCEPIVSVPLIIASAGTITGTDISNGVANAIEIVRLLNVVHKRKVKYFIIANEPGKDYGLYNYTNGTGISASDLQSISDYVKEYSIAMKMVDPDIKIIAPELEWEIPGLMDELFPHGTSAYNNAYSLKGTVPSLNSSGKSTGAAYNKQLVDYSSIHNYYGNDPANVCNNRSNLIKEGWILRNKYQNIYNTYLSGTPIKLIVDEFNLGTNVGDSYATSDFIIDTSPNANSFIGGQLAIEGMLGMMRSQNSTGDPVVDISNMWSATEGSSYSFINDASGAGTGPFYRKPSYWHYYLLANYFNGVYYDDSNAPSTVPLSSYANYGLKAFACQSSEYIAVLVINENTTSKAFSISLNNSTSETFAFNMSKSSATVHSDNIDGESSYLLFFNCTGNYLNKQIQLKRTDMTTDYPNYDMLAASHIVGTGTLSNNLMVTLSPNPYDGMLVPDPLYAPKCFGDHTTSASINLSGTPTWVSLPENISVSNTTLVPGLYKVSVAATSGCAIAEKAFSIYEKSPVIDAGLDQIVCLTGSTAFTVGDNELLTSGYNYSWSPSVTSPNTNSSQGTATVSSPTTYQMSTTDGSGCAITDNVVLGNSNPSEVFIKDWPDDDGTEPNNVSNNNGWFWESTDIWNRQSDHTGLLYENPEYRQYTCSTNPNYLMVRLTNIGCTDITGTLNLYWAKASTGLQWDADWLTHSCNNSLNCFGDCGHDFTAMNVTAYANSETIVYQDWCPPNPADYGTPCTQFPIGDEGHFCILAQFNSTADPLIVTTADHDVWQNAKNDNNVAWKNMEVLNTNTTDIVRPPVGGVIIRNITEKINIIRLNFFSPKDDIGQTLLDNYRVRVHMTKDLMKRWQEGGKKGEGIVMVNDSVLQMTSTKAYMDQVFLRYRETGGMAVQINKTKRPIKSSDQYLNLHVVQFDGGIATKVPQPQGGQQYAIEKGFKPVITCLTSSHTLVGNVLGIKTFFGDSVLITGNVTVLPGATLNFNKTIVLMAQNAKIKVQPGGKLNINHSEVIQACIGKKWGSIEVNGNAIFANQLIITNSFITGSDLPVNIDKSKDVLISGTTFLGDNMGTAIVMNRMKDFQISGNTFSSYDVGIKTTNTNAADVRSGIEQNIFLDVKTAIQFINDNHIKLDVRCNRFSYSEYAVLSTSTTLKDQGTTSNGAGNEFISTSSYVNNKLNHNGNSIKYYYDPSKPITAGMNVQVLAGQTDRACYSYSFDTSATTSARTLTPLNTVPEVSSREMSLTAVPNPNSGLASIYFGLGGEKQGELTIMDMHGNIIDKYKVNSDGTKVDLNYTGFADGIYFMSLINSKGEVINRKMVITK